MSTLTLECEVCQWTGHSVVAAEVHESATGHFVEGL